MGKSKATIIPVQTLLSLPEMVYPGSQVQWVVPCVMVQRDGRTFGPLVAAGRTEAAAVAEEVAADVFVTVTKTEGGGQGERQTNKSCGTCLVFGFNTHRNTHTHFSAVGVFLGCIQILMHNLTHALQI